MIPNSLDVQAAFPRLHSMTIPLAARHVTGAVQRRFVHHENSLLKLMGLIRHGSKDAVVKRTAVIGANASQTPAFILLMAKGGQLGEARLPIDKARIISRPAHQQQQRPMGQDQTNKAS